jgi:hypothetical protein
MVKIIVKPKFLIAALFSIILLLTPALRAGSQLQSLIAQLASDDPHQRETAVYDLMGLKRKDLPDLRAAAISQSPLLPGQVTALRQIVMQVFLAGEPYRIDPDELCGFMGVNFGTVDIDRRSSDGITVADCIPGLPAYRVLRPGDMIISILNWPKLPLRTANDLMRAIMYLDAGQTVRLEIMRSGHPMIVDIQLDFRPDFRPAEYRSLGIEMSDINNWIENRRQKAQAYWDANFAVIDPAATGGQVSTSAEP